MKLSDVTRNILLDWLGEHEQAWKDFCEHFDIEDDDEEGDE